MLRLFLLIAPFFLVGLQPFQISQAATSTFEGIHGVRNFHGSVLNVCQVHLTFPGRVSVVESSGQSTLVALKQRRSSREVRVTLFIEKNELGEHMSHKLKDWLESKIPQINRDLIGDRGEALAELLYTFSTTHGSQSSGYSINSLLKRLVNAGHSIGSIHHFSIRLRSLQGETGLNLKTGGAQSHSDTPLGSTSSLVIQSLRDFLKQYLISKYPKLSGGERPVRSDAGTDSIESLDLRVIRFLNGLTAIEDLGLDLTAPSSSIIPTPIERFLVYIDENNLIETDGTFTESNLTERLIQAGYNNVFDFMGTSGEDLLNDEVLTRVQLEHLAKNLASISIFIDLTNTGIVLEP